MLADIVLIIHSMFALFVISSLPLIWIGEWMRLNFIRNLRFRLIHIAAILFVVVESFVGMVCPLTVLEDVLRGGVTSGSFIQRWLQRILFYDVPEWILTTVYVLFAVLVIVTFRLLPPRPRKRHP